MSQGASRLTDIESRHEDSMFTAKASEERQNSGNQQLSPGEHFATWLEYQRQTSAASRIVDYLRPMQVPGQAAWEFSSAWISADRRSSWVEFDRPIPFRDARDELTVNAVYLASWQISHLIRYGR